MEEIPLALVIALVLAHWVGDWELQVPFYWMSDRKSKSFRVLALHVAIVVATYGVFTYAFAATTTGWVVFLLLNYLLHFATDAITSRLTSRYWPLQPIRLMDVPSHLNVPEFHRHSKGWLVPKETGSRYWFWATIGRDQVIHYITVMWTAWWLLM